MSTFEKWTLLTAVLAVVINAAIFIGFGLQLRLLRTQIEQASDATERDHAQRRGEATLDFVTATIDRLGDFRRRGLPELRRADVEPFTDAPLVLHEERNELIRDYLNSMEALASGVNLGIYDVAVVSNLRGTVIVRTWELYRPWIEARRAFLSMPSLYCQLEELAGKVKEHYVSVGRAPIEVI